MLFDESRIKVGIFERKFVEGRKTGVYWLKLVVDGLAAR